MLTVVVVGVQTPLGLGLGGKYAWGRLGEEEIEHVAGGNQEWCGARLGLRHLLGTS